MSWYESINFLLTEAAETGPKLFFKTKTPGCSKKSELLGKKLPGCWNRSEEPKYQKTCRQRQGLGVLNEAAPKYVNDNNTTTPES